MALGAWLTSCLGRDTVDAQIGALVDLNAKLRLDRIEAERQRKELEKHVFYMKSLLAEATVEGANLLRELQALRAATQVIPVIQVSFFRSLLYGQTYTRVQVAHMWLLQLEKVEGWTTSFGTADAKPMWALKHALAGSVLCPHGNLSCEYIPVRAKQGDLLLELCVFTGVIYLCYAALDCVCMCVKLATRRWTR